MMSVKTAAAFSTWRDGALPVGSVVVVAAAVVHPDKPIISVSGTPTYPILVTNAAYDNLKNRGQINVTALDTHTGNTPGLQLDGRLAFDASDVNASKIGRAHV